MLTAIKCRHKRNADGTWSAFLVPIFVTHTRGDLVYDRAYLDMIVRNTNGSDRIKGRPKVIVHHGRDQQGPNVGRLANLKRVEDLLFADYVNLRPAVFLNWVKDSYPGRSVELDPVSFDRIEAAAFLGNEEPYFPLSPIAFDLTDDELAQLEADVKADTSFAHAYARPAKSKPGKTAPASSQETPRLFVRRDEVRRLANELLADSDAEEVEISKLFKRDAKGKLAQFMLEPEDAQDMIAVVEELTAPLKEGIAMLNARLEAMEQKSDLEEAKDDGAGEEQVDEEEAEDEGDEKPEFGADEEDPKADSEREDKDDEGDEADSARDEEEQDPDKDSEREDEDDKPKFSRGNKEKDMATNARGTGKTQPKGKPATPAKKPAGKAATSDLATFERLIKAEAKNARHQGEQTFEDYKRRLAEVLDPAVYEDVDAKATELTEELYKLSEADRPKGLEMALTIYRETGVPTGKLPATKKDEKSKPEKGLEDRAREYHKEYRRVQGKNYQGMKEDDFVKHVNETVENDESGTRYAFLRN
jgi:hypothetical protein